MLKVIKDDEGLRTVTIACDMCGERIGRHGEGMLGWMEMQGETGREVIGATTVTLHKGSCVEIYQRIQETDDRFYCDMELVIAPISVMKNLAMTLDLVEETIAKRRDFGL